MAIAALALPVLGYVQRAWPLRGLRLLSAMAALVDKVAATFTKTKGDLREVVRTLVTAPEFYAPEYRDAKVKTPLVFVVSAVRATGREVRDNRQRASDIGGPNFQRY